MCLLMSLFDSIPLKAMNGKDIYDWNRLIWAVIFLVAASLYLCWLFLFLIEVFSRRSSQTLPYSRLTEARGLETGNENQVEVVAQQSIAHVHILKIGQPASIFIQVTYDYFRIIISDTPRDGTRILPPNNDIVNTADWSYFPTGST